MRNDGSLDRSNSSGGWETWSGSGYVLKLEPRGFLDLVNVGCEWKRGVKDDFKVLVPEQLERWDFHNLR